MADTFEIEIATPERLLVRERALSAQIPAKEGYLGILPGHAPLLGQLGIGVLSFKAEGGRQYTLAVHAGYVEVLDDHVRVLADIAESAGDIDIPRAQRAYERSQRELINASEGADPAYALAAVLRAEARLSAAKAVSRMAD